MMVVLALALLVGLDLFPGVSLAFGLVAGVLTAIVLH